MPLYVRYGIAQSLFDAYSGLPISQKLLYWNANEFGIMNADGSKTYFYGTGLVWNATLGKFTAGTITAIKHYTDGAFNDKLEGLNVSVAAVQTAFETFDGYADTLRSLFLSGNDVLDAQYRIGDAVTPVKLLGFAGNDLIYGGRGEDQLWGGSGYDTIRGGDGNDFMNGGLDDDMLKGEQGNDIIIGDGGSDTLDGGDGNDVLHGGAGNDVYLGGAGIDTAVYTRSIGDIDIAKTATGYRIIEPNGQDTLTDIERLATDEGIFVWDNSTSGWKLIASIPGALLLSPGNIVRGSASADVMDLKNTGKSIAMGYAGNDTIKGASAYDLLLGGNGNDSLAGDVNELSYKTTSNDRLYGQNGNDTLAGLNGDDLLYGGANNDVIAGGNGNDTMTGGTGFDTFVFRWSTDRFISERWGTDIINDFQVGSDHLQLVFGPFSPPKNPADLVPVLTQTSGGLLVFLANCGSILLKGVDGTGLTLDDLLI